MTAPSRRRPRRGFTLVETLAALVVAGLVFGLGLTLLSASSRTLGVAAARAGAPQAEVAAVLRPMLEAIRPDLVADGESGPAPAFAGLPDRMSFAALLAPRFGVEGPAKVELALQDGVLRLRWIGMGPQASTSNGPPEGRQGRPLGPMLDSIRFRYLGPAEDAPASAPPSWQDRWTDRRDLPLAVSIHLLREGVGTAPIVVAPRIGSPA